MKLIRKHTEINKSFSKFRRILFEYRQYAPTDPTFELIVLLIIGRKPFQLLRNAHHQRKNVDLRNFQCKNFIKDHKWSFMLEWWARWNGFAKFNQSDFGNLLSICKLRTHTHAHTQANCNSTGENPNPRNSENQTLILAFFSSSFFGLLRQKKKQTQQKTTTTTTNRKEKQKRMAWSTGIRVVDTHTHSRNNNTIASLLLWWFRVRILYDLFC